MSDGAIVNPQDGQAELQSATSQMQIAALIVMMVGLIAITALIAAAVIVLRAVSLQGNEALVVVGVGSALVTVVGTIVGGLTNALNAPSGMASVVAAAKKSTSP